MNPLDFIILEIEVALISLSKAASKAAELNGTTPSA